MTQQQTSPRAAKQPLSILAGPYGHPFHPIAIIIPIGAWVATVLFDIIGLMVDDPEPYVVGARILIIIGIAGALLATVFGLMDWAIIPKRTVARRTATVHGLINGAVIVLFAGSLLLRWGVDDEIPVFAFILSLLGLGALAISGWLGGKLSHRYGVRVADERTQAEGYADLP